MKTFKFLTELLMGVCLLVATLANIGFGADPQIDWSEDLTSTMLKAQQSGRPVLIHFYGDHCPPCRMLEKKAFKDAGLVQAINENLLAVRINAERDTKTAARFRVNRWPTDIYLYPNGDEIYRNISAQDPSAYEKTVLKVAEKNQRTLSQYKSSSPVDRIAEPSRAELQAMQAQQRSINATTIQFTRGESMIKEDVTQRGVNEPVDDMPPVPSLSASSLTLPVDTQNSPADVQAPSDASSKNGPIVVSLSGAARVRLSESTVESVDTADVAIENKTPIGLPSYPSLSNPSDVPPMVVEVPEPTLQIAPAVEATENDPGMSGPDSIERADASGQAAAAEEVLQQPVANQLESLQEQSPPADEAKEMPSRTPIAEPELPTAVAMNGFCPVSLAVAIQASQTGGAAQPAWVKGNAQFAVRHRGRVYHCVSQEALTKFLAQPDLYSPVLSGCDLVEYARSGKWIDGDCRYGFIDKETGRIFLFSSSLNCQEFAHNCESYSSMVGKSSQR